MCSGDDCADPADHAAGSHQAEAGGAEGELPPQGGPGEPATSTLMQSFPLSKRDCLARFLTYGFFHEPSFPGPKFLILNCYRTITSNLTRRC